MRFARLSTLAFASVASCGSSDLQPIREPGVDAAVLVPDVDGQVGTGIAPRDASASSARACKRGIAANAAPSAAFAPTATSPGISWWYNWASKPPGGGDVSIEFVPMIWGGASLGESIPVASKYLLGFNEPDLVKQSNLTEQQAAADWPSLEAKAAPLGIPIVSPAVSYCAPVDGGAGQCTEPAVTDPYTYLKNFFADCQGCKVDYIAVHWYNCDLSSLRGYIDGDGNFPGFVQFGKPIWLTEFACNSAATVAEQKAYMQAAVPYLENNPNVMRYAWFSAKNIPNALLANTDGSLTDLGQTYINLAQSCP
jgi:putative glycosyl hydrolase